MSSIFFTKCEKPGASLPLVVILALKCLNFSFLPVKSFFWVVRWMPCLQAFSTICISHLFQPTASALTKVNPLLGHLHFRPNAPTALPVLPEVRRTEPNRQPEAPLWIPAPMQESHPLVPE